MAKGTLWTDAELEVVRANIRLSPVEVSRLLPGRSLSAVYNVFYRIRHGMESALAAEQEGLKGELYARKEPGEYLETLSAYFADHGECLAIWLRWNGYFTCRELCRDMKASPLGIVTLLCEAKLCGSSAETTA